MRTVAGRSRVRTMARVCRGGATTIIGPAVRICIGPPSAIGAPIARIAEIVGRPSALAAAVSFDVRPHHRAATAGGCTPPAGAVRSHTARTKSVKLNGSEEDVCDQGSPSCRERLPATGRRRSRPARANWFKDRCMMNPNDPQRDTTQGLPPRHASRLSRSNVFLRHVKHADASKLAAPYRQQCVDAAQLARGCGARSRCTRSARAHANMMDAIE